MNVQILGDGSVDLDACTPAQLSGATLYRTADGRWLAPAFAGRAVVLPVQQLPARDDEDALAQVVLSWVEAVRAHDWSSVHGAPLGGDAVAAGAAQDWVDLRTSMVRVGWGPGAAQAAWERARQQPYSPSFPAAAGWAGAGWVVPAGRDEPDPAFAHPVLEARGLLRWAYITRWQRPAFVPDGEPAPGPEPDDADWAEVLSRFRQDHYTEEALGEAERLAVEVLAGVSLGPSSPLEAEDEPLPDRHVAAACVHPSPVVRAAAWFLLRAEADEWLACGYAECQHHWAVEAEEDAYELDEVLDLAGHGVPNPLDAARVRRRLLTLAFGDIADVPLAGAGDVEDFLAFYEGWVAHGRPEEALEDAARELRGDED